MTILTDSELIAGAPADMHDFTRDFFALFGATVAEQRAPDGGPPLLRVTLNDELADHFGAATLLLAFQHVDAGGGQELVAYGSRVFDQMLGWLDLRGALTALALPARVLTGDVLLRAVRPVNATVTNLRMSEQLQRILVFNWRITYRADDKREELFAVALDEDGARLPLRGAPGAGRHALDLAELMESGAALMFDDDGASVGPPDAATGATSTVKLPPMTQLARWAEIARKYAIYHADTRCAVHEAEILPRLHKVLTRLITYYEQQINEIYDAHDPLGEKRRALEADLQRKIDEEVENHRLRVRVDLYSYAILHMPVAIAALTLAAYEQSVTVQVRHNRFNGVLTRPQCHACGEETATISIDRNGHVSCDACLHRCATCGDLLCDTCGVTRCPVCAVENCEQCARFCWACGEHACPDHIAACPVCGDSVCLACQTSCAACGTEQCRTHLRLDSVAIAAGETELICPTCAVRCPGCHQFSTHLGQCSASGQRFCTDCLVACSVCGRTVGRSFFVQNPDTGAPVCAACVEHCPACGEVTFRHLACTVCDAGCCPACAVTCEVCREPLCATHATVMSECGHRMCAQHVVASHFDGERLCPICRDVCAICGQHHGDEHTARCAQCRCQYCEACIDPHGLCTTCATIGARGVDVKMTDEPWMDDRRVAELAPHYKWRQAENRRYLVYLGRGPFMTMAHVTVEKTPSGGRVLNARELGLQDLLRAKFWRIGRGGWLE